MPRPQISIGFIKKRKADRLQEFKDSLGIGMSADDVLKLAGKKLVKITRRSEKIAESDYGYIVNWFYSGVIITLQREEKIGPYKITEIDKGKVAEDE